MRLTTLVSWLASRRIKLGFPLAIVVLTLAQPTWFTWSLGFTIALVGEALRIWAAGHIEKSTEITQSGPYQWVKHPLYLGSSIIAAGIVFAANSGAAALIVAIYVTTTILSAIRTEETHLRSVFGAAYDMYQVSPNLAVNRSFSVARMMRNREHRAITGFICGFGLLALRLIVNL